MSSCPLCERVVTEIFLENPPLLRCPSCGLVVSPNSTYLIDYPEELNYSSLRVSFVERLENSYIQKRWKREVRFLKKFIAPGSSILDIGCGRGEFLKECERNGFVTEGVEKNLPPEFKNKNILKIDIEKNRLPEKKYDAITFYHSLEHMRDPAKVLRKIRDSLKDKGIVIVQVPNIDSLQFKIFKGRWFHLFLPFHRYHFSTETITGLLKECGFSLEHVRHFSNRWNPEGWSASILSWNPLYFIREKRVGKSPFLKESLYFIITLMFIPLAILEAFLKRGGVITVVARKTN